MPTRDLVRISIFAALTAVLGLLPPIAVPIVAVPITAQTLGVMLAGLILGARLGGLSQLVFAVLVVAGMPLLAGGRGGLGAILAPTGGFFLGFPVGAFVTGWAATRWTGSQPWWGAVAAALLGGVLVTYALGIPWLAVSGGLPLSTAALGSLVFVPGDLVKAVIAASTSTALARAYPLRPDRETVAR